MSSPAYSRLIIYNIWPFVSSWICLFTSEAPFVPTNDPGDMVIQPTSDRENAKKRTECVQMRAQVAVAAVVIATVPCPRRDRAHSSSQGYAQPTPDYLQVLFERFFWGVPLRSMTLRGYGDV